MLHKTCCFNAKEKRINPGQSLLLLAFNLGVPISLCQYSFVLVKCHLQSGLTAHAFILAQLLTLHHVGGMSFKWTQQCYIWSVGGLWRAGPVRMSLICWLEKVNAPDFLPHTVLKGPRFMGTPILLKSHLLLQCRRRSSGSFRESPCQACSRCDSFKWTFYPKIQKNSFLLTCRTIYRSKLVWCGTSHFGGISHENVYYTDIHLEAHKAPKELMARLLKITHRPCWKQF